MKNLKATLGVLFLILIAWHLIVAFSSDTKLTGLFKVEPRQGFAWENENSPIGSAGCSFAKSSDSEFPEIDELVSQGSAEKAGLRSKDIVTMINGISTSNFTRNQFKNLVYGEIGSSCRITVLRNNITLEYIVTREKNITIDKEYKLRMAYNPKPHFFWENNDVRWCPRYAHSKFNVQACEVKNTWIASPGYILTGTKADDFNTVWRAGLSHPSMKAYSTNVEGRWIPELGYKFTMENNLASGTTWAAGTQYTELKIIAAESEGNFNAFPGYTFPNPTKSLDVVWTPGLTNPNDLQKISGTSEGEWVDKNEYTTATYNPTDAKNETWKDHLATSAATAALANFGEWLFGKNFISNELNKKSDEELIKSAIKGYERLTEKQ